MKNWDKEFTGEEYIFGKRPNSFLVKSVAGMKPGKALCLGEGEGRNAVYLAQQGFEVTAVDISPNGLAKTGKLAIERGVQVATVLSDVSHYRIEPGMWDLITCFFMHVAPEIRIPMHRAVVEGLRPGGVYLLEGFSPAQRRLAHAGPSDPRKFFAPQLLRTELAGLELHSLIETERLLDETEPDSGLCAVTQVVAVKPNGEYTI